jgi:hypothetical protein
VSGTDPVADAAGVAAALFPATTPLNRPGSVSLVDKNDWQAGIAAAVLAGSPLHAPILLSDGDSLPGATSGTLGQLGPKGQTLSKGAQVILVGDGVPAPGGLKSGRLHGRDPYTIAASVDNFQTAVTGKPTPDVLVVSGEQPAYSMPAAAWAARSGDPVLFVKRTSIPAPTRKALAAHGKPNIYVLGPPTAIASSLDAQLGKLGKVIRITRKTTRDPVTSSTEFARYSSAGFGWDARVPLLITDQAKALPKPLESYLLDVQPGFENGDPSQGLYNRMWIMGDGSSVSTAVQARIDQLTQLVPVDRPPTK